MEVMYIYCYVVIFCILNFMKYFLKYLIFIEDMNLVEIYLVCIVYILNNFFSSK